jgi:trans-aconitate 2-methyltransferase
MSERGIPSAEWDAATYHRVSQPQVAWGERVLDRLTLRGDETALDAGCGTGRLTEQLLDRLPRGRVIALDQSQNMLTQARDHLAPRFGDRVRYVCADLASMQLDEAVDVVFSTATFHWVLDHPRLFRSLYAALKPGGRLMAQCGGGPNLAHVLRGAAELMSAPPFAPFFSGWTGTWEFADDVRTAERLRAAGFVEVETSLEPAPTVLADAAEYRDFVTTVIFRPHLERIPEEALRIRFVDELTRQAAQHDPPFLLDYWRLNLQGRRPDGAPPGR